MLRNHGFLRFAEWRDDESSEKKTQEYLCELTICPEDIVIFFETSHLMRKWQETAEELGLRTQLLPLVVTFFNEMLPRYRQVYEMLTDEDSKQAYSAHLNCRYKLIANHELARVYCGDQYFAVPEIMTFSPDEVFVDCGAFVGDTVELYIHHCQGIFCKAIAFEPGPVQFTAMKKRFRRLEEEWAISPGRLVCVQAGLSDVSSHARIMGGTISDNLIGTRIVKSDDEDAAGVVTLDEALKGQRVDFIKADIEGDEMDMLHGAAHLIRTQKPRIAICLYHKLTDPYEIPLYLKELVPEYKFKVRHHSMNFMETVLYAYHE